jgi:putative transposase
VRQCDLLGLSRSSFYYRAKGESRQNLELMRMIDEQFLQAPWYGSRQMARWLRREGHRVGRKRVVRLMDKMGLAPVYQKPHTSKPHPEHRVYPYLLRGLEITQPGHVWCADITYIPMRRGFLYLVAVMDWASRTAIQHHQGSQFTSLDFIQALKDADIKISMDGKGRWMDNVMIERLWRSLKHECVYLNAFETGSEVKKGVGDWIDYYNQRRPHSRLDGKTPYEAYWALAPLCAFEVAA